MGTAAVSSAESILGAKAGTAVTVSPNIVIVNDGSSLLENVRTVASPESVIVYHDRSVPTGTVAAAEAYGRILAFADKFGLEFVHGRGIGIVDAMGRLKRGDIAAGCSVMTGIAGAAGAMGLNVSQEQMITLIETGSVSTVVPETIRVRFTGTLPCGADMLDAVMKLASKTDVIGKSVEFCGAPDARAVCSAFCGMGAAAAFASSSDFEDADIEFSLSCAEPMLRLPCASCDEQWAAQTVPAAPFEGLHIDAGQIGGHAVGIEGLRLAASMAEEKHVALGFRLSIVPATADDYLAAADEGLLEKFIDFGAQINAVGDRSVIEHGAGTVDKGERLLTTGMCTFDGCMGMRGAHVFTASVPLIMRAACTGMI